MAGKGNTYSADFLKLTFQAVAIANIADNAASSPLTNLYWSLHTADPGPTGTATTSEAAYTSYARVAVARTSGGHAITGQSISPVATVVFPAATGGSETETFFGISVASSGASKLLYSAAISPTIVVANGVTPELTTASAVTES
jgi:hypothetical protein